MSYQQNEFEEGIKDDRRDRCGEEMGFLKYIRCKSTSLKSTSLKVNSGSGMLLKTTNNFKHLLDTKHRT